MEKYTEVQASVHLCVYVVVVLPEDDRHKRLKHVLEERWMQSAEVVCHSDNETDVD
jgi:hypothetical protein